MKNYILAFILFFSIIVMTGCSNRSRELKEVRALVASIQVVDDSLMSMKATVEGDTMLFSLAAARFNNGLMIHGDSVIINYVESSNDTLSALVVTILPKAPKYIDLNAEKGCTLLTAPSKSEKSTK